MKDKRQMSSKSQKSSPPVQPVSDCEVRDPRVRRTRQLLQSALKTLLAQKSFEEISVQDVAEAATVNRATFYDHYTDKFALLEALVAGDFHRLLQERQVRYDGTCPSGVAAVILAACDYLRECRSREAECLRQSAFEPLMDAAVIAAIRRVLLEGLGGKRPPRGAAALTAAAASGAIFGAAKEWLHTPTRAPAEKVVPVVLKLVLPMLEDGA
jgi:AcrR family transcriptional regulator